MLTPCVRWDLDTCSIRIRSDPRVIPTSLYIYSSQLIFPRLRIVDADISTATIVGVSCSILVLLFLVQPFGEYPVHYANDHH